MEVLIPYPAPNYKDKDLIVKEIVNGSFAKALFKDIKRYKYALSRYDTDLTDILIDKAAKEPLTPADVSFDIENFDLAKIKELAWLPFYIEAGQQEKEVIYNPKDYYDSYEYAYFTEKTDGSFPMDLYIDAPYYDKNNAGIAGFEKDDNSKEVAVWFYSLKDEKLTKLGNIPSDLTDKYKIIVVYVKGAVIVQVEVDYNNNKYSYLSYGFNGEFNRIDNVGGDYRTFGDFGDIAIISSDKTRTYIYNSKLEKTQELDDNYIEITDVSGGGIASSYTLYMFGARIKNKLYYIRGENSSYKWWRVKDKKTGKYEWKVKIVNKPVWKYQIKHLYDYSTDGFINKPLKFMNYNFIKHRAVTPKPILPCDTKAGEICMYEEAGGYGDFVIVKVGTTKYLFHTFDFKKWEECQTIAGGFNVMGRIWVNGRSDNIVGYIPQTMVIQTSGNRMTFTFDGYILRRAK